MMIFVDIYNVKPAKPSYSISFFKKKKKEKVSQAKKFNLIMRGITVVLHSKTRLKSDKRSINVNVNLWDYKFIEQ